MSYALSQIDLQHFGIVTAKAFVSNSLAWRDVHARARRDGVKLLMLRIPAEHLELAREVQHEIRVGHFAFLIAPVIKKNPAVAFAREQLAELLGHHLVGVHVNAIQRRHQTAMLGKRLHVLLHCVHVPLADVHEMAGDGGSRGHERAGQVRASALALAAFEVAVGGAGATLAGAQDIVVHPDAHTAPGVPPFETGSREDFVETFFLRLRLDHA